MHNQWQEIIWDELDKEAEQIMAEVNSDPALKDVQAPEGLYEKIRQDIYEYEKENIYNLLSEEDQKCLHLGKTYAKRRRIKRYVVLAVAVVAMFAFGSVSFGEKGSIFEMVSSMLSGGERTTVDSETIDTIPIVDEHEVYEAIEKEYGFVPVKFGYLPENTRFVEGVLGKATQNINIIYEKDEKYSLIYIIRPNYREASFGTEIEDEKIQEYQIKVNKTNVTVNEYNIVETGMQKWSVTFIYDNVVYMLRVTGMDQKEVENIVMNLRFSQ